MDKISWRPPIRRRPHSASGVVMETKAQTLRPGAVESRPAQRPDPPSHQPTLTSPSPDLDFTDKLKALRELIASSKSHRHTRTAHPPSRVIAKRSVSHGGGDVQEKGEKLRFTATSSERTDTDIDYDDDDNDNDKTFTSMRGLSGNTKLGIEEDTRGERYSLDQSSEKYRPHSSGVGYVLSRDPSYHGYKLDGGEGGGGGGGGLRGSARALSASSSPRRTVTFSGFSAEGGGRSHSSLGHYEDYHHEVPERDWSLPPARTSSAANKSHAESLYQGLRLLVSSQKDRAGERENPPQRKGSKLLSLTDDDDDDDGGDNLPDRFHRGMSSSSSVVASLSEFKVQELMQEKRAVYRQYSSQDNLAVADQSPPERDLTLNLNGVASPRPVQTNVQINDRPPQARSQRPHSADPTRRPSVEVRGDRQRPARSYVDGDLTNVHINDQPPQRRSQPPLSADPARRPSVEVRGDRQRSATSYVDGDFTNIHINDQPPQGRSQRPHSADPARRPSVEVRGDRQRSARQSSVDGDLSGDSTPVHWTQLLSQKRERSDSVSVPSSPATVQSNVSLESGQRASPHTFLLQEAARQLEREGNGGRMDATDARGREVRRSSQNSASVRGASITRLDDQLQDKEVASIFNQQAKPKKRIMVKRGIVKAVDSGAEKLPHGESGSIPEYGQSQAKSELRRQGSADSESSLDLELGVQKDEHLATLDKLKAALRSRRSESRRSESRPSSQASSAGTSSPSPMKAFHRAADLHAHPRSKEHQSQADSAIKLAAAAAAAYRTSESAVQRRVIKRPPRPRDDAGMRSRQRVSSQQSETGDEARHREGSASASDASEAHRKTLSSVLKQKTLRDRPSSVNSCVKQMTLRERPSSAPHFSSRFLASSMFSSSDGSLNNQGQGHPLSSATTKKDERVRGAKGRSRTPTTLTPASGSGGGGADTLSSAQHLRGNVQRLHQEVSMRVHQDAYVLHGLMSQGYDDDHLHGNNHHLHGNGDDAILRKNHENRVVGVNGEHGEKPGGYSESDRGKKNIGTDSPSGVIRRQLTFQEDGVGGGGGGFGGVGLAVKTSQRQSENIRRHLSFQEEGGGGGGGGGVAALSENGEVVQVRPRSCIPFGRRLGAGMVDTGVNPGVTSSPSTSLAGGDSNMGGTRFQSNGQTDRALVGSGGQQQQSGSSAILDNDESSFLRNVKKLSEGLATSTPRQDAGQTTTSAISAQRHGQGRAFRSHAMVALDSGHSGATLPESLSPSNLRPRRPASVGAIPFQQTEVPIGGDAADLILSHLGNASMVHLLQQLYTADDATRQAIIIKAQYFKQWRTTVQTWKHQRRVYAESLKRAHKFLISRLQQRCFYHWRRTADETRKNGLADRVHRQHMLRKGLQGLGWAVTRSKHQARTLRIKINTIVSRAAFTTWKARFESCREDRMRTALLRWREYAYEEKSVREMQQAQHERTLCQTLFVWREAFDRRLKENIADTYLRRLSLQQSWRRWCHFTLCEKGNAQRQTLAAKLRRHNLQRSVMAVWRLALVQSTRATLHFRRHSLQRTVRAWQDGAGASSAQRQRDTAASLQQWRRHTTRQTFLLWRTRLLTTRATTRANTALTRKTFAVWRETWQSNRQRRLEVEAAVTSSRLRKRLLLWRRNVLDRRRRQRQALAKLENCWLRSVLLSWQRYTACKATVRSEMNQQVAVLQRSTMSHCFYLWRDSLQRRLREREEHRTWSLACVRKMTAHWKHKCHVTRLNTTLEETEPIRQLGLLRRMFGRWLTAKGRAEEETAEVASSRHILQRCCLQRKFLEWRHATRSALAIRPLVLQRQREIVTRCFVAWHEFAKGRLERHKREKLFQKNQLSRAFASWRRQYHCQQVSRLALQSFLQRLALSLLAQWRHLLQRKQQARRYHCGNLLRQSFQRWTRRTSLQLRAKAEEQEELAENHDLRRRYFDLWWSGVQAQSADDSDAVTRLQQRSHHNHIQSAFHSWRRALHAHLVARAYQRGSRQRLLRSVLLQWQDAASQSLCSAVQHFSQQLGLAWQRQEADGTSSDDNNVPLARSLEFGDLLDLGSSEQYGSPSSSSAASVKWLFASDQSATSERWLAGDLDLDRASLLNLGLQETMEERRNKNLRLQEIAVSFVTRLSHWPVSLAFGQWLDFAQRRCHLRRLSQEVAERSRVATVAVAIRTWKQQFDNCRKATSMRNWRLQHNSLATLLEYSQHRKVKAALAKRARGHLVKHVLGKIFPWWLAKAQEQRHQRTILHLWSTATPEEQELLPLEASLSRQIRQRSLRACLGVWRVRFLFVLKLKTVYHAQLLDRVMLTWQAWSSTRQEEKRKSNRLLESRRLKLAYGRWCQRLHQKRETERRYQSAQHSSLQRTLLLWRHWASVNRREKAHGRVLEGRVHMRVVTTHFNTWRRLTHLAITVRAAHQSHLMHTVLVAWRQATQDEKQVRHTILTFQTASLTSLVGQLFARWRQRYAERQQQRQTREEKAQQRALVCGQRWRRMARQTRGRKLIVVFKYSRLSRMFNCWRSRLAWVAELQRRQGDHTADLNRRLLQSMLGQWRQRLQSETLARNFSQKLQVTVLCAWQVFAKASKERHIRGLALQSALQERNLRQYFVFWRHLAVRVRSLQNNVEQRLQLRVLQAWSYVTRRRSSQRRLGEKLCRLRQQRAVAAAFMTLRCRFDYCQALADTAQQMCQRRDAHLARLALHKWKDGLDNITARRFYIRLLSVRVAGRWLTFVAKVKAERRHEAEQLDRAVRHRNAVLCRAAIGAFRIEVKVTEQLQRRRSRLAVKFASGWKRITDMTVTAVIVEEERLYSRFWGRWRLARVRKQAVAREMMLQRRQALSQAFLAWRARCPSQTKMEVMSSASSRHAAGRVMSPVSRVMSPVSGRDSPTTPRSFLPVPKTGPRRSEPSAH